MSNQFQNENITVNVHQEPGSIVKFDITVHPEAVKASYLKAMKNVKKEISVPGFRKGKAPDNLVLQTYRKYVDEEFKDITLNTAFKEAITLTQLQPFTEKSLKKPQIKTLSKDSPVEFSIEFEASPVIPDIDASHLNIVMTEPEAVKDSEIEETIKNIQLHHATWQEINDRPVQEGDYVTLDILSLDTQEPICEDQLFDLTEGKTATWMRRLIIGKNVHDVVEGVSEKEPAQSCKSCESGEEHTHEDHDHNFQPTNCQITIKKIKVPQIHELNDELAAKVGAKSIQDLLDKIRLNLEQKAKNFAQDKMRYELEKELVKKYSFEIPSSISQQEIRQKEKSLLANLNLDELSEEEKERKKEEIKKQAKEEVEARYRSYFILEKIIHTNNISITQEELTREFLYQISSGSGIIDQQMDVKEIQSRLTDYLSLIKAQDFLIEKIRQKGNS